MKKCINCKIEKESSEFENRRNQCKKCRNEYVLIKKNDKYKTSEGYAIIKVKGKLRELRKKIKIQKKVLLSVKKFKILLNDVFQQKSFFDGLTINPNIIKKSDNKENKDPEKFIPWFISLNKELNLNNAFICKESEFGLISKYGYGETRHALDIMFPEKTVEERNKIVDRIKDYDELKKKFGIWENEK